MVPERPQVRNNIRVDFANHIAVRGGRLAADDQACILGKETAETTEFLIDGWVVSWINHAECDDRGTLEFGSPGNPRQGGKRRGMRSASHRMLLSQL